MNWYLKVLKNYAVFNGRARRMEYWMFTLFNVIISLVLAIIGQSMFKNGMIGEPQLLNNIYSLVILIPLIAVSVRRLHDIDKSGWWFLLFLIPIIGTILMIFFFVQQGTQGRNRFGEDPLIEDAQIIRE